MDRRGFLGAMVGGISLAAARTWPFRVYSFPSEIKFPVYDSLVYLVPGGMVMTEDGFVYRNETNQAQTLRLVAEKIVGGSFAEVRWTTRMDPLQFPQGEIINA